MNLSFLGAFNATLFITLMSYILFFVVIIESVLIGMKRGLVRSSIRLGTLLIFIIIAGLITLPISKAIMGIDVSGLGVEYDGKVASTLTELVKFLLFGIDGVKDAAAASPALTQLLENIPIVVISLLVFTLLTWILRFISWLIYYIIQRFALKSSRIEKQIKKQKKAEKKAKKKGGALASKNQILKKPKRNIWLGALVGLVQGIVLAFVLFFPISSICGIVGDLSAPSEQIILEAEENTAEENLNQKSGDLVRYYLGNDVLQYFDSYNNTFVSKFVAMGGLNYVVFDEITKIEVENENFYIRQEIFSFTSAYDEVMDIINFDSTSNGWSSIDVGSVKATFNKVFKTKLISKLVPELLPYALDNYIYKMELFTELPYSNVTKTELNSLISNYKKNGFMEMLNKDFDEVFKLLEAILDSELVDNISSTTSVSAIKSYLVKDDNKLLKAIFDSIYNSDLLKVFATTSLNYAGDILTKMLEITKPLNAFECSTFSAEERKGIEDVVLAILDGYDNLKDIGSADIKDMSNEQINQIAKLLTTLQNNSFKKYDENKVLVDRTNAIVNVANQDVTNGGPFSNVYIVLVDHFAKQYIDNIAYKDANWSEVLYAVKSLTLVEEGETPKLEDVMTIVGLDKDLSESASEIASSLKEINEAGELTKEKTAELLNNIASSADNIDETKFNSLVDKVGTTIGDTSLKDKISYEIVEKEKNAATTLAGLYSDESSLNESNADEVLNNLTESEHILQYVADTGVQVNSSVEGLEDKINALETSQATKDNLKSIFGINVG